MKKEGIFIGLIFILVIGLVAALDFSVEVGEIFEVKLNYSCEETLCDYEVGLGSIDEQIIDYHHEDGAGIDEADCFDGTCLTMPLQGPVYNLSGNVRWGCGICENVENWFDEDIRLLAKGTDPCFDGMKNSIGEEICMEADNGGQWNLIMEIFSGSGSDEFKYIRRKNSTNFIDSTSDCVSLNGGENPINFQLNQGESREIIFDLSAEDEGVCSLNILKNGTKDEEITVTIFEEEDTGDSQSSSSSPRKMRDINPYPDYQKNEPSREDSIKSTIILGSESTNEIAKNYPPILIILGIFSLVLLITIIIIKI